MDHLLSRKKIRNVSQQPTTGNGSSVANKTQLNRIDTRQKRNRSITTTFLLGNFQLQHISN
jgi:hypothetical protein